jgi:hypothetical protein
LTFSELARECPAIAELKADAASIAMLERWPWYEPWIGRSRIFATAVHQAAQQTGEDPADIRGEVLDGLLDTYAVARRRRAKRQGAA